MPHCANGDRHRTDLGPMPQSPRRGTPARPTTTADPKDEAPMSDEPKHTIPIQSPPFRRLRTYAFDPSLGLQPDTLGLNETILRVPWEPAHRNGREPAHRNGREPAHRNGREPAHRNGREPAHRNGREPAHRN